MNKVYKLTLAYVCFAEQTNAMNNALTYIQFFHAILTYATTLGGEITDLLPLVCISSNGALTITIIPTSA